MKTVTLSLLVGLALLAPRQEQPRQAPAPYTYQGTVQAVQPQAGSLDLLTGVGFALRILRIGVASETRITAGAATLALGALEPGDVVRAECRRTERGLVAERIERLETAP